jgi:hypothetical protein
VLVLRICRLTLCDRMNCTGCEEEGSSGGERLLWGVGAGERGLGRYDVVRCRGHGERDVGLVQGSWGA